VVGLDGSPASITALSWAVAQAREWGSTLVPVVVSGSRTALPDGGAALTAAVWRQVIDAGGSDLEVHPRFVEGDARLELLAAPEAQDLLVIGAGRLGTLGTSVVGSTAHAVALAASSPVVVVREGQARREVHQRQAQPMIG
jgi:nucleotide-binding universal stress UspA family protein